MIPKLFRNNTNIVFKCSWENPHVLANVCNRLQFEVCNVMTAYRWENSHLFSNNPKFLLITPPPPLHLRPIARAPPLQVYCPAVMRIRGANPITPLYLDQSAVQVLLPLCILTNLRSRCGPIARTLMRPSCGANSIARPLMRICRGGANPIGGGY